MAQRKRDPIKERARSALRHAVQAGKVVKPSACSKCGEVMDAKFLHGHHFKGYDCPLEVEWLCVNCHNATDKPLARKGRFVGALNVNRPKTPAYRDRWEQIKGLAAG